MPRVIIAHDSVRQWECEVIIMGISLPASLIFLLLSSGFSTIVFDNVPGYEDKNQKDPVISTVALPQKIQQQRIIPTLGREAYSNDFHAHMFQNVSVASMSTKVGQGIADAIVDEGRTIARISEFYAYQDVLDDGTVHFFLTQYLHIFGSEVDTQQVEISEQEFRHLVNSDNEKAVFPELYFGS